MDARDGIRASFGEYPGRPSWGFRVNRAQARGLIERPRQYNARAAACAPRRTAPHHLPRPFPADAHILVDRSSPRHRDARGVAAAAASRWARHRCARRRGRGDRRVSRPETGARCRTRRRHHHRGRARSGGDRTFTPPRGRSPCAGRARCSLVFAQARMALCGRTRDSHPIGCVNPLHMVGQARSNRTFGRRAQRARDL